jgi:cell division protein FtsX
MPTVVPKDRSVRIRMKYFSTFLLALVAGLFSALFYERYWKWREFINASNSSFRTPDGANLTSGGALWLVLAVAFVVLATISYWKSRAR